MRRPLLLLAVCIYFHTGHSSIDCWPINTWGQPTEHTCSNYPNINVLDLIHDDAYFCDCYDTIVKRMFVIPAETFSQGTDYDPCSDPDELPFIHTLTRDMMVMETEVTRQMWADLKLAQLSLPNDPTNTAYGSGMNHPVQYNTWYEALLFANLLSIEQGLTPCYYKDASFTELLDGNNYTWGNFFCEFDANGFRLPTEGEWEYFTRAGTTTAFSIDEPQYDSGSCVACQIGYFPNLETVAIFCGTGHQATAPVGSKLPNPWGLKDVHGNVNELCWDWYLENYPTGSVTDYTGPLYGISRIFRGGRWGWFAKNCRSAFRSRSAPDNRSYFTGFRLIKTAP